MSRIRNFKVGDKVIVKTRKQLLETGRIEGRSNYRMPSGMHIVDSMFNLCGKEVTILHVSLNLGGHYKIEEQSGYSWTDELFLAPYTNLLKDLYA